MSKLKNKKRVTSLLAALALVFVVGAAFAFATGMLSIQGTIILEPDLRVEFESPGITHARVDARNNLQLNARDGVPNQVIEFTSVFTEPNDEVTLSFSIRNTGAIGADVGTWLGEDYGMGWGPDNRLTNYFFEREGGSDPHADRRIPDEYFTVTGTWQDAVHPNVPPGELLECENGETVFTLTIEWDPMKTLWHRTDAPAAGYTFIIDLNYGVAGWWDDPVCADCGEDPCECPADPCPECGFDPCVC